jgi:hypothetical protein
MILRNPESLRISIWKGDVISESRISATITQPSKSGSLRFQLVQTSTSWYEPVPTGSTRNTYI